MQVAFAQIASGFGRDPILNAEASLLPVASAHPGLPRSLNIMEDGLYLNDGMQLVVQRPW